MNRDDLQAKRELLKLRKRQALIHSLIPTLGFICQAIVQLSNHWPGGVEFASSILAWAVFWWYVPKATPVFNDIQQLKEQIQEEERATWREGMISRIRSGEFKPNPLLK